MQGTQYSDPVSLSTAKTQATQTAVEMDNKFLEYKNTLKSGGQNTLMLMVMIRLNMCRSSRMPMVAQAKRQAHDLSLRETRAKIIADYKVPKELQQKADDIC